MVFFILAVLAIVSDRFVVYRGKGSRGVVVVRAVDGQKLLLGEPRIRDCASSHEASDGQAVITVVGERNT